MWYLLLSQDVLKRTNPALLEIGVYKGQVISLWSLIAAKEKTKPSIYAISPLAGTCPRLPRLIHRLMVRVDNNCREDTENGNQYPNENYLQCLQEVFANFNLSFSSVTLFRGYSQASEIKSKVAGLEFDLIYVDGSHRYQDVLKDIEFYGERIKPKGYLVLDDASYFQPGKAFWKGHQSVSRAAEKIPRSRFSNILNIGHNRIYMRNHSDRLTQTTC
jgi:hypothetical protein